MALNPGDLMFVGFDSDNEDVAFVTTVDLAPGEVIYFTDDEWDGSNFNENEQLIEWVIPAGGVPAGTVVEINMVPDGGTSSATFSSGGSVDYIRGDGQLAGNDEMFWAFQGTRNGDDVTPTNFIGVIANEADGGNNQTPNLTGTGLTTSNGAVIHNFDRDYLEYTEDDSLPSPVTRADLIAFISDLNNWTGGQTNPNGSGFNLTFPPIVCFTTGTLIQTPGGPRVIESLSPGDLVNTRDHGPQPIRWIGQRTVLAKGAHAPVLFAKGALGNTRDLWVSPHHRMLITGWRAQALFDTAEVLVPAIALVNDKTIRQQSGGHVTYLHILFDQHEIVLAEDIPSESFFPGAAAMDNLEKKTRNEILALFPELATKSGQFSRPARMALCNRETHLLGAYLN
ncbi:Hint domain-containing protein [Halovulum sp. GXIMD14793]